MLCRINFNIFKRNWSMCYCCFCFYHLFWTWFVLISWLTKLTADVGLFLKLNNNVALAVVAFSLRGLPLVIFLLLLVPVPSWAFSHGVRAWVAGRCPVRRSPCDMYPPTRRAVIFPLPRGQKSQVMTCHALWPQNNACCLTLERKLDYNEKPQLQ